MREKITEYFLITSVNPDKLNEEIAELIEEGWQPFGGIAISECCNAEGDGSSTYAQAVVFYATTLEEKPCP